MASVKTKPKRMRRIPVNEEERQIMLFYYTLYEGNYSRTAKATTKKTGIPRSRKVVLETAKKYNFATLSHVLRDRVNKEFYGNDTPGMGRMLKLGADLVEIDEELLMQVKKYLGLGVGRSKIQNIKELLDVVKHVGAELSKITGDHDLKNSVLNKISQTEGPKMDLTIEEILRDMDPDQKADVLGQVIENQMNVILEYKGEQTKRTRAKRKKANKTISEMAEEAF